MSDKYEGPVKLAIFESTGRYVYRSCYTESEATVTDNARISEWVEVTFPFIDPKFATAAKVEKLDAEIEKTLAVAMKAVAQLRERRAELLAISWDGSTTDSIDVSF